MNAVPVNPAYSPLWWAQIPVPPRHLNRESDQRAEAPFAFGALVAFTCILLLTPQNRIPALKPLRIAFIAAGLAAASMLWERWRLRKPFAFAGEIVLCFALLTWSFITLPLSYWPGGSVTTLTNLYIKAVIVFWLLGNVVTTEQRLRFIAAVLMLCSVPLAVTGVENFINGKYMHESGVLARISGYDAGLTANPNDLALMLNLLLPLSVALFLSARGKAARTLCVAIIGINVIGVIVTFSRAGFLGLATIGLLYFLQMVRRQGADRGWAFSILFVVLIALPLLPSSYIDRVSTVTSIDADPTGSSQIRWRDTVAATQFVLEHPVIGAGLGMDWLALNQVRGQAWYEVHNVYLQYAVDLGVPGIVLFVLLFLRLFTGVRASRRRLAALPEHRNLFLLVEALEISLTVFAISAFFYPVAYQFYFYYVGGLALASRSITDHTLSSH